MTFNDDTIKTGIEFTADDAELVRSVQDIQKEVKKLTTDITKLNKALRNIHEGPKSPIGSSARFIRNIEKEIDRLHQLRLTAKKTQDALQGMHSFQNLAQLPAAWQESTLSLRGYADEMKKTIRELRAAGRDPTFRGRGGFMMDAGIMGMFPDPGFGGLGKRFPLDEYAKLRQNAMLFREDQLKKHRREQFRSHLGIKHDDFVQSLPSQKQALGFIPSPLERLDFVNRTKLAANSIKTYLVPGFELGAKSGSKLQQAFMGIHSVLALFTGLALYRGFGLLTANIATAVREVIEFDKQMRAVQAVSLVTDDRLSRLRQQVIALAKSLPRTPSDLGSGLYTTLQSGFLDAGEASKILATAARASIAGLTDTKTAVGTLVVSLKSYGLGAEHAARVSDILFQSQRRGIFEFSEMQNALGTVLPVSSAVGISFEEIAAALSTMTKQGLNISRSSTALRQLFANIADPTKEVTEFAELLGIQWNLDALRAKGLAGFMEELTSKLRLNEDQIKRLLVAEEDLTAVSLILQERGFDPSAAIKLASTMRGMMAVLGLAGNKFKDFAEDVEAMKNATGSTDEAFAQMEKSISFRIDSLRNKILIALEPIKPLIVSTIGAFEGIFNTVEKNSSVILTLITQLGMLLTAFIAFKVIKATSAQLLVFHKSMNDAIDMMRKGPTVIQQFKVGIAGLSIGLSSYVGAIIAAKAGQKDLSNILMIESLMIQSLTVAYLALAAAKTSAMRGGIIGLLGAGAIVGGFLLVRQQIEDAVKDTFDPSKFEQIGVRAGTSFGEALLNATVKWGRITDEQIKRIKDGIKSGLSESVATEGILFPAKQRQRSIIEKLSIGFGKSVDPITGLQYHSGDNPALDQALKRDVEFIREQSTAFTIAIREGFREFQMLPSIPEKERLAAGINRADEILSGMGIEVNEDIRKLVLEVLNASKSFEKVSFESEIVADGFRIIPKILDEIKKGTESEPPFRFNHKTITENIISAAQSTIAKFGSVMEEKIISAFDTVHNALSPLRSNFESLASTTQQVVVAFMKLQNTIALIDFLTKVKELKQVVPKSREEIINELKSKNLSEVFKNSNIEEILKNSSDEFLRQFASAWITTNKEVSLIPSEKINDVIGKLFPLLQKNFDDISSALSTPDVLDNFIIDFQKIGNKEISEMIGKTKDIFGPLSSAVNSIGEGIRKWRTALGGLIDVTATLKSHAQTMILMGTLEYLNQMNEIATALGRDVPKINSAILAVQMEALKASSDFLDKIANDPRELARILAEQNFISQTINNEYNNNIVIRISGDAGLNPQHASEFADALMKELLHRQTIASGK